MSKYESTREAAQHSPYIVVLNPSEPDGIQTELTPLSRDKFREVLGDTRSGCYSLLRDHEGLQPQEAVDAMVKFLFAKWYDEQATIDLAKQTGESQAYVFSVSNETDPERLLVQVRDTFEKAKQWEQETLAKKFGDDLGVRLAFNEADVLQFKPHTTMEIVKRLQPWSLRKSSADVKGGVFEDFLSKTFRDDLGQYFTPTPVINRCLEFLAPGGKLAIVLPDGVLANSSMQDIRDWILRWARLKAVISLPQETFMPYGAAVKTSVVILEKREIALTAESQLELSEEVNDTNQDYEICMVRIDDIGYDSSGRISASEDEVNEPSEVRKAIADLVGLLGS